VLSRGVDSPEQEFGFREVLVCLAGHFRWPDREQVFSARNRGRVVWCGEFGGRQRIERRRLWRSVAD